MFESKTTRNTELMRDYRRTVKEILASGRELCREKAIRKMLAESRPDYHVTYTWAVRMMREMIANGKPCPAKGLRRKMWEEFRQHVEGYMQKGAKLADAVMATMLNKRASGYFITYKQASKIIYHETEKNRHRCPHRA